MLLFSMQSERIQQLSSCLEQLSDYANTFGAESKPFISIDQLRIAEDKTVSDVLSAVETRLKTLSVMEVRGSCKGDIQDEIMLFNEVLRINGLAARDNVSKYFDYGDIIEIYSLSFTQIYGNLQFMRFCSYDLFTLYTKPFYELYSRNSEYDLQIKTIMETCFNSFTKTEPFAVEPHLLKEIHQKSNKLFKVHPKWISPLVNKDGEVKACVLTNRCIEYRIAIAN